MKVVNATNHNMHVYLYPDGTLLISEYHGKTYAKGSIVRKEILRGTEAEIEE